MKNTWPTVLKTVLYLAVVVLLNLAATTLFFRVDLTRNKLFTLSDASKDVVATLREPLTIKAYFSQNMPAPYNNIEQQVLFPNGSIAFHVLPASTSQCMFQLAIPETNH